LEASLDRIVKTLRNLLANHPRLSHLVGTDHIEIELLHSWLDDIRHHEVSMLPLGGTFLAYRGDIEARFVEIPSILR
jgi:hypothetical protein